jgi:hypothetical protein
LCLSESHHVSLLHATRLHPGWAFDQITGDRPLVPGVPLKRVMKERWPVNIYQDQYESLQQLALEERKQGGMGSMSAMVREAIDKLIAERRQRQ